MTVDIKDRLERLESRSAETRPLRGEIVSDLRKRLERLIDPRQIKRAEEPVSPITEWVEGEEIDTPHGKVFMTQEVYRSGYRHGGRLLDCVMEVPTYPVSWVSGDERLVDLDFSQTLFIDVETTGLAGGTGTYAFMVGVGYFERGRFVARQLFLRDFSEERAMLWVLGHVARRFPFLVTFNGKRFDIPLLETRFILSQMENPFGERPNYDLLSPSRRIWRGAFENCRLTTLESCVLGIEREDDVPSEMIPYLYFDYLRRGDGSRIHRVFYHNRMDILSLVTLAARIHELVHTPQTASWGGWVEAYSLGKLFSRQGRLGDAIRCYHHALRACKDAGEWAVLKSLSLAMKREKQMDQAVSIWVEMISFDGGRELFPYEELAKFYEHQLKDYRSALKWVREAFQRLPEISPVQKTALEHRHQRLLHKVEKKGQGKNEMLRDRDDST